MVTLEETLKQTCDWAIDRMHQLCEGSSKDTFFDAVEDASAIHEEFYEWLDPNNPEQNIFSLEYIGDEEE